eukprot:TRINITY_DN22528_c0_g1_i3.p1 TRINITY_DN22528_c0_g1~~TRINITY_DN22528_c0_g1_i3.p1  ORF type:complete len:378 (+),score=30.99 TRINITY_DN22528_c0_g1_i3:170-1303(+)
MSFTAHTDACRESPEITLTSRIFCESQLTTPETNAGFDVAVEQGCDASGRLSDGRTTLEENVKRWHMFVIVALWWSCSIGVVLLMKDTVNSHGVFPYAFTFAAITQMVTALSAWLLSFFVQTAGRRALLRLRRIDAGQLFIIGLMQGFEIALTNKALQYVSIPTRTVLHSTSVLFMMISAGVWGLERLGWVRAVSGILIVLGGCLQGLGNDAAYRNNTNRFLGVLLQVGAILIAPQRWCFVQVILQRSPHDSALGQMSKLLMLAHILPVSGVICFIFGMVFEPDAVSMANPWMLVLLHACAVAVCLTLTLWMEFVVVNRLSAVALSVLCAVHQIPLVLLYTLLEHTKLGPMAWLGFGMCTAGAFVYAVACRVSKQTV